jgi:hypothetical protein
MCLDTEGNVYITGGLYSPIVIFGNDTITNSDSMGSSPVFFIAKYDAAGNVIWGKSATGVALGLGISADAFGNIYTTGGFAWPDIIFGSDTLSYAADAQQSGIFGNNVFVAKYSPTGNIIWAKLGAENSYLDFQLYDGATIVTDAAGSAYATGGYVASFIVFGNDTLFNPAPSISDNFIVKYDSSGNVIWALSAAESTGLIGYSNGINGINSYGIALDGTGNAYVTGYFTTDTATFGSTVLLDSYSGLFASYYIAKLKNAYVPNTTGLTNVTTFPNQITVFPNPSTSTFNFTGVTPGSTIQIYNVLREIIYISIVNSDKTAISLNSQSKGIYFYRVSDKGNDLGSGKIILE